MNRQSTAPETGAEAGVGPKSCFALWGERWRGARVRRWRGRKLVPVVGSPASIAGVRWRRTGFPRRNTAAGSGSSGARGGDGGEAGDSVGDGAAGQSSSELNGDAEGDGGGREDPPRMRRGPAAAIAEEGGASSRTRR
jgi:hypothetical protein